MAAPAPPPKDGKRPSLLPWLMLSRRGTKGAPERRFESSGEQRMTVVISKLLRGGILLAVAVVLLGAALYLYRHGRATPLYHAFTGEPSELRSLSGILAAAFSFSARGIIMLGLLILLATPVIRVALALLGFRAIGDRLYTGVAGVVLALLIFSLAYSPA